MAAHLNRSYDAIAAKMVSLGLTEPVSKPYTDEEIGYIKANIGKQTLSKIALHLGRTQSGISKYVSKQRVASMRKKSKGYLQNIQKDIPPIFSKGANYLEILIQMKVGDSFEFPHSERFIVQGKKYEVINDSKGYKEKVFIIRKTDIKDGIQMARIWRLL